MLIVAFSGGFLVVSLTQGAGLPHALLLSGAGALIGAATELFDPSEYDTVTVPVMILTTLLVLKMIFL